MTMLGIDGTAAALRPYASSRDRGWDGVTIDVYRGLDPNRTEWPSPPDLWVSSTQDGNRLYGDELGPVIILAHLPSCLLESIDPISQQSTTTALERRSDAFVADICRLMLTEVESPSHSAQEIVWASLSTALAAHLRQRFSGDASLGLTAAAIFNAMESSTAQEHKPSGTGSLAHWQEQRAKALLIAQMSGQVLIADIAAACDLSRTHFSRSFKGSTGQTPHQWLTLQRVERAKRHLLHAELSLPDIASDCGFSDQSHFTRVFTAWTGTSPRNWQRRYRSQGHPTAS